MFYQGGEGACGEEREQRRDALSKVREGEREVIGEGGRRGGKYFVTWERKRKAFGEVSEGRKEGCVWGSEGREEGSECGREGRE